MGNDIVEHSDVWAMNHSGGAAPTTSSFSTWLQWIAQKQLQDETRDI